MSTEIKSASWTSGRTLTLTPSGIDAWLTIDAGGSSMAVKVPRADFLKAVADELDLVFIERSDLPEVTTGRDGGGDYLRAENSTIAATNDAADLRSGARRLLALAEYLDANPPTDPKVEALTEVIRQMPDADALNAGALAEALIATGRVEVTP